jgi:hypothetical protein
LQAKRKAALAEVVRRQRRQNRAQLVAKLTRHGAQHELIDEAHLQVCAGSNRKFLPTVSLVPGTSEGW